MVRLPIFVILAAAAFAQTAPPASGPTPPPEVDQALRARIQEFYDLLVKGQFRKAESLVAEDTKERFYNQSKPRYKSAEIVKIVYADDFTHATATIKVQAFIEAPGFPQDLPIPGQFPSTWKLDNGQWCWFVDPTTIRTPWGTQAVPPGMPGNNASPGALPPGMGASGMPPMPQSTDFLMNKIKADRTALTLAPGGSGEVAFTNLSPGIMTLAVETKPSGIEVKPERQDIRAGEKLTLHVDAGKNAKSGKVELRVEQTLERIAVEVTVK
jgi:hypothetical protein